METLSTSKGGELNALLRDKTGVGFSMRGLAELEHLQDHNVVKSPLTIISFDAVSMPSHKSAVVDFNEMKFEQTALLETASGLICANGRCFMPDYFDKLIENNSNLKDIQKWLNDLMDLKIQQIPKIPFSCMGHVSIKPDLLEKMKFLLFC